MPMKKIHVEFELDPELFMKMLQHGSSSMKISVFGDEKKAKLPKEEAKLLGAPKQSNRGLVKGGAKKIIMDYAKVHKDGFSPTAVREPVMEAGYAKNTTSPQLMALMQEGFLKRKNGSYFPTDKGMTYGQES
jgi:hypothetical protein